MKENVRIEVIPDLDSSVVIQCRELTADILKLRDYAASGFVGGADEMLFSLHGEEFIVPLGEVLFFESRDDRVAAHTAKRMYYTENTLTQLMNRLGADFFRVSKSCIVNLRKIGSLKRELTGVCEVRFSDCDKQVLVSRMYYKSFRERLEEVRFGK